MALTLRAADPPAVTVALSGWVWIVGMLPEANWICADLFDIWQDLPRDFDSVIGNPPFGRLMTDRKAPRYTGPEFELKIIDIAGHLGTFGMFILPQGSTPFRYSGAQYYQRDIVGAARQAGCDQVR